MHSLSSDDRNHPFTFLWRFATVKKAKPQAGVFSELNTGVDANWIDTQVGGATRLVWGKGVARADHAVRGPPGVLRVGLLTSCSRSAVSRSVARAHDLVPRPHDPRWRYRLSRASSVPTRAR